MNNEKRNIFISFSFDKNNEWKEEIENLLFEYNLAINYSEKEDKSNLTEETIWKGLEKRIKGSSVTVLLLSEDLLHPIGKCEFGNDFKSSGWVYKEISASLRDWKENRINGLIVLSKDNFYEQKNWTSKKLCNGRIIDVKKNDESLLPTIIKKNMYNVKDKFKKNECFFDSLEDSYVSIISWKNFKNDPEKYINNAFEKRKRQIENKEFEINYNFHNGKE